MKNNNQRYGWIVTLLFIVLVLLSACGGGSEKTSKTEVLKVWTTSNTLKDSAEAWGKTNKQQVEVTVIPYGDFDTKLKQQAGDASTAPDVFIISRDFVKDWVAREEVVLNVEAEFPGDVKDYKEHVYADLVDLGSNEKQQLVALTGEYPIGMMFYNRALAKELLGADDPTTIADMMSSMDKWSVLNKQLQQTFDGKVKLFGTLTDTFNMLSQQRSQPFVKDNTFTIDEDISKLFDQAKRLYQENMFFSEQENEAYQAGYNNRGFLVNYLPSWGFSAKISPQIKDKEAAGQWGLALPMAPYARGGSYFFITKASKLKQQAWDYVKSQTTDTAALVKDQQAKVGFPSSKSAAEDLVKTGYEEPLLGNQKVFELYQQQAIVQEANQANIVTQYDGTINQFIGSLVNDFGADTITKKEALQQLEEQVQNAYPNMKIVTTCK